MTRYSTLTEFDTDWIVTWAKRVNEDRVLKVIGRFFTANFVIGVDDHDFYIQVRNGKIEMVADEPNANLMGWQFALRAPASSWSKFVEPVPAARCTTTSGRWRIRCTASSRSRATPRSSGRTCAR